MTRPPSRRFLSALCAMFRPAFKGRSLAWLALLVLCLPGVSADVRAQPAYKVSGQVYVTEYKSGEWDGQHSFPGVFCARFPMPEKAVHSRWAFFNNFSIYLSDAAYPDNLYVTIASSRLPKDQTPPDAVAAILANERNTETQTGKAGYAYTVSEMQSAFGPTVGVIAVNPSPGSSGGPFPLTRAFIAKGSDPLQSMSVHRLFVRGQDRFEIAVIQMERTGVSEAELRTRLTRLADELMSAMQQCTAAMPPKKAD